LASSCCSAASSARPRSSSTGRSSFTSRSWARATSDSWSRAGPLAVVVELRLQALEVVEVDVALASHLGEHVDLLLDDLLLLLCVLDVLVH
jgi:hypothetical protein